MKIAINFDLSTQQLKNNYSQTSPQNAYRKISKFMMQNNATHKQGSMYLISLHNNKEIVDFNDKLFQTFPWLQPSMKSGLVSRVYGQYDLKSQISPPSSNKKSERLIHFDVDTTLADAYYQQQGLQGGYEILHKKISDFCKANQVGHPQGSVYHVPRMSQVDFDIFTHSLFQSIPELRMLTHEISVSKVGRNRDMLLMYQQSLQQSLQITFKIDGVNISLEETNDSKIAKYSYEGKEFKIDINKDKTVSLKENTEKGWKDVSVHSLFFTDEIHCKLFNKIANHLENGSITPMAPTKELEQAI